MNPSNPRTKSKRQSQISTTQTKQKPTTKQALRPTVEQIYPIEIQHPQLMSPQLKQYIAELEREYIERYNIMLNNRIKYDQVIQKQLFVQQSLAITLDQKGISNHVVAELLKNSSYHHEME